MSKVVIINGLPRSGKDTFVQMCGRLIDVTNISIVDYYKNYMRDMYGWNGKKTRVARNLLAALLEYDWEQDKCSIAIKLLIGTIRESDNVVFIHCRQPYIIKYMVQKIRNVLGCDAITLLIDNNRININDSTCDADRDVRKYDYDYIIANNGTLNDLRMKAYKFIKEVMQ